ncbi:MAG: polysaccharide biosynthesis/export family protein [Candidatus Acidiferrales bacterium]
MAAAFLCVASGSCLAQASRSENSASEATPAQMNTAIGPDDSVTIVVLDSDEISKTWRVSSKGDLSLPLVGTIHAAGLTAEQLREKLSVELKRYIRDPQVTVYVSDVQSQPVTIAGAVHKPGTYQLEGPKTLLEVLMMGLGPDAAGPTLIVSRPVESGPIPLPGAHLDSTGERSSIELKLSEVLDPSTPASNLEIHPNDVISVSNLRRLVYIIGEVARPGAVELVTQDQVSVMQVLAAAGGLTKVASPRHSEIMRLEPHGTYKRVSSIDLKRVMTGKDEDRLLSSGDIIVVPSSTLKSYGQIASTGAITTGLYIITRY